MESTLVDDPLEMRRFLIEASKTGALATLWTAGQENVISARLGRLVESDGVILAKAAPDCDPAAFAAALRSQGSGECYFNIPLLSASILFKAELKGSGQDGLRFALPEVLYKTQRRTEMRLALPSQDRPSVRVGAHLYPLLDISPGGLCFLASDEQATAFCQGIHLEGIEVSLASRAVRAQGEVRHAEFHVLTEERLAGTRVGVQFKGLSDDDERYLTAFVYEGTRKFLLSNF